MPAGTAVAVTDSILYYMEEKAWEVNEIYAKKQKNSDRMYNTGISFI